MQRTMIATFALLAANGAAETAFAQSMADRDIEAFAALLAEDAVFFGRDSVSRDSFDKGCDVCECAVAEKQ